MRGLDVVEPSDEGCRWSRLPYYRAFLRQHLFGEPSPIARTQWQHGVVEIVMRVVQYSSALGAAIANPDIGVPGFPLRKQAKSSAPMLGNRSRLTLLSPTSDAAAVAAISVSGAALAVSR